MSRKTTVYHRGSEETAPVALSRRTLLGRAGALGVGLPLLARQSASAQGTPSPAAPPPTGEPITIGASISTTGSNGRTGQYQQEAYLLWEEQKNAAGGVLGRPVRMVIYDDQSDPATGARLYERLITEDQVNLILGPYASSVTQAVAQVTERYGQPLLVAGASAGEIWERGYRSVFGVYSIAQDYFRDIVLNIATAQGYKTAAVMYEDTIFPTSTAQGAIAHCGEAGIEVVVEEQYPAEATDVSSALTRVRDAAPDMLIGGSYLPDSVLITRQAKELGVNPKLFAFSVGAAQPDFLETLGPDANFVLGPSMWEPEIETEGNADFLAAYRAKWSRDPDYHAATGYAGCQILEAAVTSAGEINLEAITEQLFSLTMPTVLPGQYQVDETGKQTGHIPLTVQWQEGAKALVAPEDLKTGDLVLPTPPWDQRG
ncbi:MAG: amino acid ABC transporter substrate-binding protein [Chloroflexia bacterium]|nr:amino acid ABC transporter substrate-binding protein [Chloroflexia bacterium]